MTETKKAGRPKIYKVAVGGAISNGEGGYFEEGDALPDGCDVEGLVAKGLVK